MGRKNSPADSVSQHVSILLYINKLYISIPYVLLLLYLQRKEIDNVKRGNNTQWVFLPRPECTARLSAVCVLQF